MQEMFQISKSGKETSSNLHFHGDLVLPLSQWHNMVQLPFNIMQAKHVSESPSGPGSVNTSKRPRIKKLGAGSVSLDS